MREKMKTWISPVVFTLGGAAVGFGYYALAGCAAGGCMITSNPFYSIVYMGLVGWLLSVVFRKESNSSCSM